ncbi:hypothetical protein V866_000678 [Kwoniella sp. B9012]
MTRIALVTGASSGIGREAAIALHQAGWTVIITARRQNDLEETLDLMKAASLKDSSAARPDSLIVVADLTVSDDVDRLYREINERYGRLDLLFNNAGVPSPKVHMEDLPLDKFNSIMAVNVTAIFHCAQKAISMMKKQQPMGGRIINNGSVSAYTPRPLSAPYTMSKHSVLGLTKSIALDCRQFNIACSQLDIGNAQSSMSAQKSAGVLQADGSTAAEPVMDASWAGEAVVYMAGLPLNVNVLNQTLMATNMPFVGRG